MDSELKHNKGTNKIIRALGFGMTGSKSNSFQFAVSQNEIQDVV